jgi:hypothetical protein
VENPKINAIQVFSSAGEPSPVASGPPIEAPTVGGSSQALYRVNACGGEFVDSQGQIWEAGDAYVHNGLPFGPVSTPIAATVDDALFQTECYDPPTGHPMRFEFPVENGSYEIRLGMAEVYGLGAGLRVFTVKVEGKIVLQSHDIFAKVGANTADIETVTTDVADGVLTVEFEHVMENPKVCTKNISASIDLFAIVANFIYSSPRSIVLRYIRWLLHRQHLRLFPLSHRAPQLRLCLNQSTSMLVAPFL